MKLNHINLPVRDVAATRDFFVHHFGMRVITELPGNIMALLEDEGGMVLNLSHFRKGETAEVSYHRDFHVGFIVDSNEEVEAVHARLVAAGLDVAAPKRRQGGRYGFYHPAPGGFELEVECLGRASEPAAVPTPDGAVALDRR